MNVTVPEGFTLQFFFRLLDIESHDDCAYDYVQVCNGVITLTLSATRTRTGTGTDIMQKSFTLAVSGTRIGHLKAIEISLKHTT